MLKVSLARQQDLITRLLRLGQVGIVRAALAEGGQEIVGAVRSYAPGSIKNLLAVRMSANERVAVVWAGIDMKLSRKKPDKRGRRIRYAYIVEYGTRPHRIDGVLRFGGEFARGVDHPGFQGRRYFSRGVRSGRPRAKTVIEAALVAAYERFNGLAA